MNRDLAKVIAFYITIIEVFILVFSYQAKQTELNELRISLEQDVLQKTGKDFHELHPGILDQADIDKRMNQFLVNIAILTALIIVFTWGGVLFFFHNQVGKHIVRLKRLNQMNRGLNIAKWRNDEIPDNEVGDLIRERERLVKNIEKYKNKANDS